MNRKTTEQIAFERDFTVVAGMSGDKKTVTHILQLLRSADIQCSYEGSVIYDLYVERTKVERALQLLHIEKAKGWDIVLASEIEPPHKLHLRRRNRRRAGSTSQA